MKDQLDTLAELLACPFCGGHLQIRRSVNPYGFCGTEGCWMSDRKISVALDEPAQFAAWNTRDNLPAIREQADEVERLRAAFKRYATHDGLCGIVGGYGYCTCGRDAALNPQENSNG